MPLLQGCSRARTAIASATETLASAGTRAGCPYTASIAATNRESKHRRHRTSCVDRPGRTKAVIAMRSSPFLTRRLHARQHARLDGAVETLYVLGRCLNVMLYAPPAARPGNQFWPLIGNLRSVIAPTEQEQVSVKNAPSNPLPPPLQATPRRRRGADVGLRPHVRTAPLRARCAMIPEACRKATL